MKISGKDKIMSKHLNLARKWRSKQFDQIVGQELSVRMLKNSLYLNQFFPVYLFSGQRGCGKTTTARVFASALNCEELEKFQKDPRSVVVPCLKCSSCVAMAQGTHPDFIEMDAASHTGVDNVRTIVEAASLMPVMGSKKIYLIDEAHMLSKAAFNAFLKILEEPPESVVFMLATTDPQKIIDTVRSRCFQLFFTAITSVKLVDHLKKICTDESISYDEDALNTIVNETEGSARDAINLLEQVRFSHAKVTQEAVRGVLGHMDEASLLKLFGAIVKGDQGAVLSLLESVSFEKYDPVSIWKKFQELIRSALFAKYGVKHNDAIVDQNTLRRIVTHCSVAQLNGYMQALYENELVLLKTTVQHSFLEMLFLKMSGVKVQPAAQPIMQSVAQPVVHPSVAAAQQVSVEKKSSEQVVNNQPQVAAQPVSQPVAPSQGVGSDGRWETFVGTIETLSDPMLKSIFKQSTFLGFDKESKEISVQFAQDMSFFSDWLKDTKEVWQKALNDSFGEEVKLKAVFPKVDKQPERKPALTPQREGVVPVQPIPKRTESATPNKIVSSAAQKKSTLVDVTDKEKWEKANKLLDAFGGTIVEVHSE